MPSSPPIPIVVFAQAPPPEHGQSRMVLLALETLRGRPDDFEVHHVDARFSETLEEIGSGTLHKGLLIARYLLQAIRLRFRVRDPLLYYVPGPVKWSSVIRDWIVLFVLRLIYPRTVFHWHAIGQGEWARGSQRLRLEGPRWIDRCARTVSGWLLRKPCASIAVSPTSTRDGVAISSRRLLTVCNGIEDPCPDHEATLRPARAAALRELGESPRPRFRILFISHGTVEKGLFDAIEALRLLLGTTDPDWRFGVTFAGGVSELAKSRFEAELGALKEAGGARLTVQEVGYVSGREKDRCYREHDILLAASRWESFGLTVLEAMAYSMRIVAAASDGVKGVLPADHPDLAPPADPRALAEALRACCDDLRKGHRPDQGIELRKRFLESFQIRDFAGNLRSALLELGGSRAGAADPRRPGEAQAASPGLAPLRVTAYLADQNPGHDRSFGISRMSQAVLEALHATGRVRLHTIASETSQHAPPGIGTTRVLPWGTRRKSVRLLTDHFYPLFARGGEAADLHYFPKGYLPLFSGLCRPSVVTIHDTIIQYDEDRYPEWRSPWEYAYWAWMLKHTLREADLILTVSEASKAQILAFMDRHGIPRKEVVVTFEPCVYESLPQPVDPPKENYVIHLASTEPHKRSAHLIRWWHEAESAGLDLPMLHLIGSVPREAEGLLASSRSIVKRPFLEDHALQAAYREARALILPSEIEGFGLPALEAYYLGAPVCFVAGTSVAEVLGVATGKGAFSLDDPDSLVAALEEVMAMSPAEVRACGLKLRETYAAAKVAARMLAAFDRASGGGPAESNPASVP